MNWEKLVGRGTRNDLLLKHLQEALMKTLASRLQTPQQSFVIHPVTLISFRTQYPELVNLQCVFLFFPPVMLV